MSELLRRAAATEEVLRRFQNRAFDWKAGHTCLHLARAQLLAMGHRPPRIPAFRSALGARRAMERAGYANLAEVFDRMGLPRIAPATMWVGDLALVPGTEGFAAVFVCAGGPLVGWHDAGGETISVVHDAMPMVSVAWRL